MPCKASLERAATTSACLAAISALDNASEPRATISWVPLIRERPCKAKEGLLSFYTPTSLPATHLLGLQLDGAETVSSQHLHQGKGQRSMAPQHFPTTLRAPHHIPTPHPFPLTSSALAHPLSGLHIMPLPIKPRARWAKGQRSPLAPTVPCSGTWERQEAEGGREGG